MHGKGSSGKKKRLLFGVQAEGKVTRHLVAKPPVSGLRGSFEALVKTGVPFRDDAVKGNKGFVFKTHVFLMACHHIR